AKDAFHFIYNKFSGDVSLTADVAFVGKGKELHRKACLMIRDGLDADSAYVDVAVHGDGMTSLQFRNAKGDATHEVQSNLKAPARLRLVVRGNYALLFAAQKPDEEPRFTGAAVRVLFAGPLYAGLALCAHDKEVTETATFSNVSIGPPPAAGTGKPTLYSTLE